MVFFQYGWFASPIVDGQYPTVMRDRVDKISADAGLSESRLPSFSLHEKELVKGTYDFFALNHYTSMLVRWKEENESQPISHTTDMNVDFFKDPSWQNSSTDWLTVG